MTVFYPELRAGGEEIKGVIPHGLHLCNISIFHFQLTICQNLTQFNIGKWVLHTTGRSYGIFYQTTLKAQLILIHLKDFIRLGWPKVSKLTIWILAYIYIWSYTVQPTSRTTHESNCMNLVYIVHNSPPPSDHPHQVVH